MWSTWSNQQVKIKYELTYTAIVILVHRSEHSIGHEAETVCSNQTQRLFVVLQSHLMVNSLSLEPLREIVDLIIIHFESPCFSDFPLDVFDGLLEPLFANFGTAAKGHSHLELL